MIHTRTSLKMLVAAVLLVPCASAQVRIKGRRDRTLEADAPSPAIFARDSVRRTSEMLEEKRLRAKSAREASRMQSQLRAKEIELRRNELRHKYIQATAPASKQPQNTPTLANRHLVATRFARALRTHRTRMMRIRTLRRIFEEREGEDKQQLARLEELQTLELARFDDVQDRYRRVLGEDFESVVERLARARKEPG